MKCLRCRKAVAVIFIVAAGFALSGRTTPECPDPSNGGRRSTTLIDVPEGYVAVDLPIERTFSLAELESLPGQHRDIVLTVHGDKGQFLRKKVIFNALILSIQTNPSPDGDSCKSGSIATFALTNCDNLIGNAAKEMGVLEITRAWWWDRASLASFLPR
jgi:hypothetical protein